MAAKIKFHLDEHIHPAIATGLRVHGIDVTTTGDADLIAAADSSQLLHAVHEGRVFVTHDDDFLKLHAKGQSHAGIAYVHAQRYSLRELLQMLLILHACFTAKEMRDGVEFL
jgi:predicted nuclease of predicted toxin-antitoxin system